MDIPILSNGTTEYAQTTSEMFLNITWQSLVMIVGTMSVGFLPLYFTFTEKLLKRISLLGAVLMIGFILILILPEGFEDLNDNYPENGLILSSFQIGGLSVMLGFAIMMFVDLIFGLHGKPSSASENAVEPERNESFQREANQSNSNSNIQIIPKENLLSFGFCFHAACDGVSIGAATYTGQTDLIVTIFIGIFVHKLVVALCLVVNLLTMKTSKKKTLTSLIIFSLACPLAAYVILGILILADAPQDSMVPGILIAISAGTLLYVGTAHSLPEAIGHGHDEYKNHDHSFMEMENINEGEYSDDQAPMLDEVAHRRDWIDYVGILIAILIPVGCAFIPDG